MMSLDLERRSSSHFSGEQTVDGLLFPFLGVSYELPIAFEETHVSLMLFSGPEEELY